MSNRSLANTRFPICCLALDESSGHVVVGGGGGPTKSGIKNGFYMYRYTDGGGLEKVDELLTQGEPAMCCRMSRDGQSIYAGVDRHGWKMEILAGKLLLMSTARTDYSGDEHAYQRLVATDHLGRVYTVGCDGTVRVWRVRADKWEEVKALGPFSEDISDIDCGPDHLSVVFPEKVRLYALKDLKEQPLNYTLNLHGGKLRACRWSDDMLIVAVNGPLRKNGFIDVYCTSSKAMVGSISLPKRAITAVSAENGFVAVGSADGSICLIDLFKEAPSILYIRESLHPFTVTSISIRGNLLASASGDGVVAVERIFIADDDRGYPWILMSIVVALLAYLINQYCTEVLFALL